MVQIRKIMEKLKIAFVTPEATPFAKTGGLADVSGALPNELKKLGHDVRVFMPGYSTALGSADKLKETGISWDIEIDDWLYNVNLKIHRNYKTAPTYFVGNDFLYDRKELYVDPLTGSDYVDNAERFVLFSRAVIESFRALKWMPDIIHANDWQSAPVISLLKTLYAEDSELASIKTLFTIHNIAYQGIFDMKKTKLLEIEKKHFAPLGAFEYWGKLNFMKSGIFFADKISTVSPSYAEEVRSGEEYGMGLQGLLEDRQEDLVGIINGVDYKSWSPQKDKLIPHKYIIQNLSGKKQNKLELLNQAGLPIRIEQPLIGMISRLDNQKGFDIIKEMFDEMMSLDLQFILLGTGDAKYHEYFEAKALEYPDKFKPFLAFDNKLAHLIEAGSDLFLMPSKYEPCGLNQLYSLKYGTAPIVRKTGGLADTIEDWDETTLTGTGFVFEKYDSGELLGAVKRALTLFSKKRTWFKIVKQGMKKDFSWKKSANEYIKLYRSLGA